MASYQFQHFRDSRKAEIPDLCAHTKAHILEAIASSGHRTLHYTGAADEGLLRALLAFDPKLELSVMDMPDRHPNYDWELQDGLKIGRWKNGMESAYERKRRSRGASQNTNQSNTPMPYHPPFTLTPRLLDLVSRISEALGRWVSSSKSTTLTTKPVRTTFVS